MHASDFRRVRIQTWVLTATVMALASQARAVDEDVSFFETNVRPVLVRHCEKCHSSRLDRPKGKLRVDTREGLRSGGASGPAIVAGKPEESLLILAVERSGDVSPMPPSPEKGLPPRAIADLRTWIEKGAVDPRTGSESPKSRDSRGTWWSLEPLKPASLPALPPELARAVRDPIDIFILSTLAAKGLVPAPEAGRRTLIRRLSFDLLGLPPSYEETQAFLDDPSPDAYERLVDRCLASPHFGERQARHWMDLVHFAETHGHDQDRVRPNAWPYRDYLIRSFNANAPYPRFIQEQVAADVLFPGEPALTVALGFLAAGPWDESSLRDIREDSIDRQIGRYLDRDDVVTTVMSTFTSTTVHCARCHDHKFDPISQADYYGLQSVFAGVERADRAYDLDPEVTRKRSELSARLIALKAVQPSTKDAPPRCDIVRLEAELAALPKPRLVYAAASDFAPDGSHKPFGKPRDVHILDRGDIHKPKALASPGALSCVSGLPSRFAAEGPKNEGARRAALATWLSSPSNPLTWRSIVNRVWQHHFGRGLVDSPNDFGRMGNPPTHPELLDRLATDFRDGQGDLKGLHRRIVLSSTYRQSSQDDPSASAIDADNRLLWRQNRRRLDAESARDAMLFVSGGLDRTMEGPSIQQFRLRPGVHVTPVVDYGAYDWKSPGANRRSVYRFLFRTLPDPFMDALDAADASQLTAARTESLSPLQALALWNDAFVIRQSERFAESLGDPNGDRSRLLTEAYRRAFLRVPEEAESRELADYAKIHGLINACRVLFNSSEFLFVD